MNIKARSIADAVASVASDNDWQYFRTKNIVSVNSQVGNHSYNEICGGNDAVIICEDVEIDCSKNYQWLRMVITGKVGYVVCIDTHNDDTVSVSKFTPGYRHTTKISMMDPDCIYKITKCLSNTITWPGKTNK